MDFSSCVIYGMCSGSDHGVLEPGRLSLQVSSTLVHAAILSFHLFSSKWTSIGVWGKRASISLVQSPSETMSKRGLSQRTTERVKGKRSTWNWIPHSASRTPPAIPQPKAQVFSPLLCFWFSFQLAGTSDILVRSQGSLSWLIPGATLHKNRILPSQMCVLHW